MAKAPRAVTYQVMLPVRPIRWMAFAACTLATLLAYGQGDLSLSEALRLAKLHNGDLAAAQSDVRAAKARERQAFSAFLPTITPSLNYSDSKEEVLTGNPKGTFISSGITTVVEGRWKLLDSGERDIAYRSSKNALSAETLSALQTLRTTLVTVYTQYFDALRAQELVRVSEAQKKRSEDALAQTEAQIKVGEAAEKDRYQPKADALNAEVERLSAEAQRRISEASLKATIGFDMRQELPALQKFDEPEALNMPTDKAQLSAFIQEGLANRADLLAARKQLASQDLNVRLAKLNAGITWSVDLAYTKQFTADNINNRVLGVSASIPLFDGARSREVVREAEAGRQSSAYTLEQNEREIEADIESQFYTHELNFQRVGAAKSALEAAKVNYERVSRAKELGAQGTDVVAVSTAQATLATAERNYVEAIYDFYISEVRLQLAVGRPIKGEDEVTERPE